MNESNSRQFTGAIYEKPNVNNDKFNYHFMTMSKFKANKMLDKPLYRSKPNGIIAEEVEDRNWPHAADSPVQPSPALTNCSTPSNFQHNSLTSTPSDTPMPFYSIPLDPPEPFLDIPYNPPKRSASQRSSFNLMAFAEKCLQQYDQMRRRPHTEYNLNLNIMEKEIAQAGLSRSKTQYRVSKTNSNQWQNNQVINDASIGHLIQWGQTQHFVHSGYEYLGEDAERERRNRLSQGAVSVASSQPIPNASQESLIQFQVPPNHRNTTYTTYTVDDKRISLEPEICHIIQQHNQGLALNPIDEANQIRSALGSPNPSKRESMFSRFSLTMKNVANKFYQHGNQPLAEIVVEPSSGCGLSPPNRALFRNSMQSPMPSLRQIDVSSSSSCSIIEEAALSTELKAGVIPIEPVPTHAVRDSGLFHRPESVSFLDKYPNVSRYPTWSSRRSTTYDRVTDYLANQPLTFFLFYLGFIIVPLWWFGSMLVLKNAAATSTNVHGGYNRAFMYRSRCRYMTLATLFIGLIILVGWTWVRPDWAGIRVFVNS